jgi:hypothetical protein
MEKILDTSRIQTLADKKKFKILLPIWLPEALKRYCKMPGS